MAHSSYSFICLNYLLIWLCISMVIIQFARALNDDFSFEENSIEHELTRRDHRKVVQMLQQMLQRGEMQVQPSRIRQFLDRLHRRKANTYKQQT